LSSLKDGAEAVLPKRARKITLTKTKASRTLGRDSIELGT
jgi:hypothetical protein